MPLSPSDVDQYRREGFVIPAHSLFSPAKFETLRLHFEEKLSRLPEDVRPESMDVPHFTDPQLFDWLLAPEVLDLIEPIVGPDIVLFSSHFICKPPGHGKRVPWHEDSYYWKGMMNPMEVCTVWLAIDPSTKTNGCMKVVPRALHGYSEYESVDPTKNVFATEIKRHQVDEARAVALELSPNHCSLHDCRLMHASDPNTSSLRRCGYTMRYMPATVKLNTDYCGKWHQIYLARGRDRAGNQYADPTKAYPHLARYRETSGRKGH